MLTDKINAICYDDFNFKSFTSEVFLSLVANDDDKQIRVCYGSISKPKGIKQIITINYEIFVRIREYLEFAPCNRRLFIIEIPEGFMKKPDETPKEKEGGNNINIFINSQININNIYNENYSIDNHSEVFNNKQIIKRNNIIINKAIRKYLNKSKISTGKKMVKSLNRD